MPTPNVLDWIGDIASLVAAPAALLALWQAYEAKKAAREALKIPRIAGDDSLEFVCRGVTVNHVPFATLSFVPRRGDTVLLPSEGLGTETGAGSFEVERVECCYDEDTKQDVSCPARLAKIVAYVKPLQSYS